MSNPAKGYLWIICCCCLQQTESTDDKGVRWVLIGAWRACQSCQMFMSAHFRIQPSTPYLPQRWLLIVSGSRKVQDHMVAIWTRFCLMHWFARESHAHGSSYVGSAHSELCATNPQPIPSAQLDCPSSPPGLPQAGSTPWELGECSMNLLVPVHLVASWRTCVSKEWTELIHDQFFQQE